MNTTWIDFSQLGVETPKTAFYTLASDIGIPAGQWPACIAVRKNGSKEFRAFSAGVVDRDPEGDVMSVRYVRIAADGSRQIITVFND